MENSLDINFSNIPVVPMVSDRMTPFTEKLRSVAELRTGEYASPEHAIRLPADTNILADVQHVSQRCWTTQLRYVFVVGIGGSNLGAEAIYDALRDGDEFIEDTKPKLIFLDTVSSRILHRIAHLLDTHLSYPEEFAVIFISKSGTTTESLANFLALESMLIKRFPKQTPKELHSRMVVITDRDSILWKSAERSNIALLAIPKAIGGRFSVFSPVGLLPLSLAGVDIVELTRGANEMLVANFEKDNIALRMGEALYRAINNNISIVNFFFFDPELESLGKWARQLFAESLGKEKDRSGRIVHAGITPIVSIGSTDLHSMAQLYLGGPKDKITIFVRTHDHHDLKLPLGGTFVDLNTDLKHQSANGVMDAIYEGTKAAYTSRRLPFAEIRLPALSPYALGMFMELEMLVTVYLGELMYVYTFDQPNVEEYKKVTKELLHHNHQHKQ